MGSGFEDSQYIEAEAAILDTPAEVYDISDMVMHVKEPQPSEYGMIKKDQPVSDAFGLPYTRLEEVIRSLG
ncbi:MAG: hypothetical protein RQ739_05815 [Desulfotignum sp.]|nr:hypothetical protein [Desulfotignum sp.]